MSFVANDRCFLESRARNRQSVIVSVKPDAIHPSNLKERLDGPDPPVVLDVREPEEIEIVAMPGALHLPLADFARCVRDLDRNATYVVVCHHGIRSAHAAAFMLESGFTAVLNLLGGIDAWAIEVDPSLPRY
jgi:rhodanese-related sulfurtransferase